MRPCRRLWCYRNEKETATSFEGITQEFVFMDESTRTDPQKNSADQYREIYQHYLETERNHDSTFKLILKIMVVRRNIGESNIYHNWV